MIFCFDLDGTLCTHREDGRYDIAHPLMDRIGKVNELHAQGHEIIIDTARGTLTHEDWYDRTREQLKRWGVKYSVLRVGMKPYADLYIDDHATSAEDFFGGV